MNVQFKRLTETAKMPAYAHEDDAGMDICADENLTLKPGERAAVKTGLCVAMTSDTECQVRPRSGLALKHGIGIVNSPGTIDAGFRGEICVILINWGHDDFKIEVGMRIAQLVFAPVLRAKIDEVKSLPESNRGKNGFGSTGV